eukprot:TRINITY_DN1055_c0_g1_i2.p1 TRINITY_DN1055_c0_g1~~TRINITY_DN1055_c0_g1_i2.p1  ORF type:complete len:370 (-),score=148.19 TRINITY_DN1055_c0_g1_i2:38-1111(-)
MRKTILKTVVVLSLLVAVCLGGAAQENVLDIAEESVVPTYLGNVVSYTYRAYKFCVPFDIRAQQTPNLDMIVEVDTQGQDMAKGYPVIVAINWDLTPGSGLDTETARVLMSGENVLTVPLARFGKDPLDLARAFVLDNTVDSSESFGPAISGLVYSNAPISNIRFTVAGSLSSVQYGECATCSYKWDLCGRCGAAPDVCLIPSGPCKIGEVDICDETLPFQIDVQSGESDAVEQIFGFSEVSTVIAWLGLIPVFCFVAAFAILLSRYDRRMKQQMLLETSDESFDLDEQIDSILLTSDDKEDDGSWGIYPKLSDSDEVSVEALNEAVVPIQLVDEFGRPQIYYVSASHFSNNNTVQN